MKKIKLIWVNPKKTNHLSKKEIILLKKDLKNSYKEFEKIGI